MHGKNLTRSSVSVPVRGEGSGREWREVESVVTSELGKRELRHRMVESLDVGGVHDAMISAVRLASIPDHSPSQWGTSLTLDSR